MPEAALHSRVRLHRRAGHRKARHLPSGYRDRQRPSGGRMSPATVASCRRALRRCVRQTAAGADPEQLTTYYAAAFVRRRRRASAATYTVPPTKPPDRRISRTSPGQPRVAGRDAQRAHRPPVEDGRLAWGSLPEIGRPAIAELLRSLRQRHSPGLIAPQKEPQCYWIAGILTRKGLAGSARVAQSPSRVKRWLDTPPGQI